MVKEEGRTMYTDKGKKVIVGDIIFTDTGDEFVFAVDDMDEHVPYAQIDTLSFNIVDKYPAKLFEDDVKIGYEMPIGGTITGVIRTHTYIEV